MTLTLLVRDYCHLCDDMRANLQPLLATARVSVEVVDVDDDPVLEALWGDKVPVLMAGDQELCHHRLDRAALTRWLTRAPEAASR
ncbi:MAG: glutaredoxin family protein [Casimicrobiaceae bacterium]